MKLRELLAGHDHEVLLGDPDTRISAGACFDAHRVSSGSLFIAVPGHREGGPEAVGSALARGAVAVLVDRAAPDLPAAVWASAADACVVRVPDTRVAAAVVTSRYYGEPGRDMDMVAVTGTNGKTSVSYMVESVLRIAEGAKVGVIGTSGSRIGDELIPMPRSVLTTPESPDFQYLLGHMRDHDVGTVVLEATSMGLLNHRVDRAFIDVGIFTNLTQDHLDDHGTMENYRDAKLRLFQGLCRLAVVNADDPVGAGIKRIMPGPVTTYGIDAEADYRATDLSMNAFGTRFTLHHAGSKYPAAIPVPGRFSVANALAAVAACHLLGHDLAGLVAALDRMPPVPGRLERFETPPRFVRDRGLRPLPRLPGQGALRHPGLRAGPGHHPVRLRGRPGRHQARADGRDRRDPLRSVCPHLGQPTERGPRGDHGPDHARARGHRHPVREVRRPPPGHRLRPVRRRSG